MELAEIIGLRPVACAGLLVSVTRRCPLACAHCSTASARRGTQLDGDALLRFAGTFTSADRPDVVMFTGGEPLLRPRLVAETAAAARAAGSKTALLTGAFFARGGRLPPVIGRTLRAVDHCSVSLDRFHESQVSREDVFGLLRELLDTTAAVSLHIVGTGPDDPYLRDVTSAVLRAFGHRVPMLVSELQPVGRAAAWRELTATGPPPAAAPGAAGVPAAEPCALAAWPVVAFDGTVTACCNEDVVDGVQRPAHLVLGHIATTSWGEVRRRCLASPALRLLRSVGPRQAGHRDGTPARALTPAQYCAACHRLDAGRPGVRDLLAFAAGAAGELLDREAGRIQAERGPADFVRRHGCARYASLVAP